MTATTDQDIEVTNVAKNSRERVRVALRRYSGHQLIDLRTFFQSTNGEYLPTAKGVSISIDRLADLRAALDAAEKQARAMGWITTA